MVRILAASDIHSDHSLVKKLANKAKKEKADLVVLCGDLTMWGEDTSGIIGPFKEKNIEVLMIHGNHEDVSLTDFLSKKYGKGVYNIHTYYRQIGDVAIIGFGGSEMGMHGVNDDELFTTLKDRFKNIKAKKKILVTHEPPYDTALDNLGWTKTGSLGLRRFIEAYKPDYVLCGHIHETFGKSDKIKKTTIINAGRNGVILDL